MNILKKHSVWIMAILFFMISTIMSFAEFTQSVDLTVTGNSGYSSTKVRERGDDADYWILSGDTRLKYTLENKGKKTRGQAQIQILGNEINGNILEISRAYMRTRIPFAASYSMQIEMGKNSIAWGEGSYYNAGDVIFGADPKDSNLGSNAEYRDFAHWQLRTFFPINSFSYIEAIMGVPDQEYSVTDTTNIILAPTTDISELGVGGRIHIEIEAGKTSIQFEAGGYSRFADQKVAPYISIALPLVVKFYVASGMEIDYDDESELFFEDQVRKEWGTSGGFLYTRGMGRGGTITLGGEALYKNTLTKLQINTSWGINRILSIVLRGDTTLENREYSLILGPQWTTEAGFTMSVFSVSELNMEDEEDNNTVYTGLNLVFQYKY